MGSSFYSHYFHFGEGGRGEGKKWAGGGTRINNIALGLGALRSSQCTPGYLWSPETKKYEVPMSEHDGLKSRITSNVIHAPSTDEV